MLNVTNIPAARVPFVDSSTGLMTREWYRFFYNIFLLSGGGTNQTTLNDLQIGPPVDNALSVTANATAYTGPDYQCQFQELANNIQSLALQPPVLPEVNLGTVTSVDTTGNLTGGPITSSGTLNTVMNPTFTTSVTTPTLTSPSSTALAIQSSGALAITVDTSQKVGVGTGSGETIGATLEVKGAVGTALRIRSTLNSVEPTGYYSIGRDTDGLLKFNGAQTTFVGYKFYNTSSEVMRINGSGNLICGGVYSATIGATNRDVYVDDTGLIGYVSSTRASKTNIFNITDVSWLLNLIPVSFNRRKKDEYGKYTDKIYDETEYGLIAEDVKNVNDKLCFYDNVDGNQELRGVHYGKLVTPMLKLIQDLVVENADIKTRLAALEAK